MDVPPARRRRRDSGVQDHVADMLPDGCAERCPLSARRSSGWLTRMPWTRVTAAPHSTTADCGAPHTGSRQPARAVVSQVRNSTGGIGFEIRYPWMAWQPCRRR
jgi:hypothetical protein